MIRCRLFACGMLSLTVASVPALGADDKPEAAPTATPGDAQAVADSRGAARQAQLDAGKKLIAARKYTEARRVFQKLLAADPNDVEALVGMGDSHPRYLEDELARPWYEKALALQQGQPQASLAIGIAEAWYDPSSTRRRADALRPGDPTLAGFLDRQLLDRRAPSVGARYLNATDSFTTQDQTFLEARTGLASGSELSLTANRSKVTTGDQGTTIDSALGSFNQPLGRGARLRADLGVTTRTEGATSSTEGIGGVRLDLGIGRLWGAEAEFSRTIDNYAANALAEFQVITTARVAGYRWLGPWVLSAEVGQARFTAGSDRLTAQGGLRRRFLAFRVLPLEAGYRFEYSDQDQRITTHRVQLRTGGVLGRVGVFLGLEPIFRTFEAGKRDDKLGGYAGLSVRLSDRLRLEGLGAWGDYRVWGAQLNWRAQPR